MLTRDLTGTLKRSAVIAKTAATHKVYIPRRAAVPTCDGESEPANSAAYVHQLPGTLRGAMVCVQVFRQFPLVKVLQ